MIDTTRHLGTTDKGLDEQAQPTDFARSLAIVVGITDYANGIPPLSTPTNDAARIAQTLQRDQQYQLLELVTRDVTRAKLATLFSTNLPEYRLGASDRLLVYFAGHGTSILGADGEPEYFLIPQDARPNDRDSFLPMRWVRDELLKLECRHLLVVLDCCFAGGFGRLRSFEDPPDKVYRQRYDFYVRSPAWQVIASAAFDETALDTAGGYVFGRRQAGNASDLSPFAQVLTEGLSGKADANPPEHEGEPLGDGLITATELYAWVRDRVQALADTSGHRQCPGLWPLPKHQAGEYVFRNPLRALTLDDAPPPTNPYRGLSTYDVEHSRLFFGRKKQIADLAALVDELPFVAVVGASGTGKSSLVKAGLVPVLGESHRTGKPVDPQSLGDSQWLVLPPFRPGPEPVAALTKLLRDHLPDFVGQASLDSDPAGLAKAVTAWRAGHPDSRLLLVVDQLEELVTLCSDEQQRRQFQELFRNGLAESGGTLRVVITLRTDFEPSLAHGPLEAYWALETAAEPRHTARFVTPPMSQDDLRQVILGPAWASELYFESQDLVDTLINEVVLTPGGLPLLSFTLSEMFIRYAASGRGDRTLRREHYDAVGGVIGSLRTSANKVWVGLDEAHRATMERLMLRMVAIEGGEVARRRVAKAELDYGPEENARRVKVVGQLEAARLVVEGGEGDAAWIEPAHDALVSGWDKLMEWKLKADYLPLQRELAPVALRWQAAVGKAEKAGLLWDDDPRLPQVKETLWPTTAGRTSLTAGVRRGQQTLFPNTTLPRDTRWLNKAELEFTQASVRKRARFLQWTVGITLLVIAALAGLTLFASNQANQATIASNARATEVVVRTTAEADAVSQSNARATQVVVRTTAEANAVSQSNARATEVVVRTTAEAVAKEQSNIATARQQAAEAQNIADRRLDYGLLLGVEASRRSDLVEVRAALLDSLLVQPQLRVYLPGHPQGLFNLALSPDGKVLAAGTLDNTIMLWDVASGKPIGRPLTGHTSPVISVAFSPDGKMLASGGNDPFFRLWDVSDPSRPALITTLVSGSPPGWTAFSSDGRALTTATGSNGRETARLWNSSLSALGNHDFVACNCGVLSLAFSPDGKTLALGAGDGHLELWDVPTRGITRTLNRLPAVQMIGTTQIRQPDGQVWSLSFSHDGKWLASGSAQGYARAWDLGSSSNWPSRLRLFGLSSLARVAMSPNGYTLVYSNGEAPIYLWDLASSDRDSITETRAPNRVLSVAFSPDGKTLALGTTDHSVVLWDIASRQAIGKPLTGHDSEVHTLAFSSDGKTLASGDWNHNIILWDLGVSQRLGRPLVNGGKWTPSVAFSPYTNTVVSTVGITSTSASLIVLWDLTSSPPISRTLDAGRNLQSHIALSADGKTLAASDKDAGGETSILVWDLASGQPPRKLDTSGEDVAFSADGQLLAVSSGTTVTLWSVGAWLPAGTLSAGENTVTSLAFSKDRTTLAAGTEEGPVILWHTPTGQQLGQPLAGHAGRVNALGFSSDGKLLASGGEDRLILLWNVETREQLGPPLSGHTDAITGLAFNPRDETYLRASGGRADPLEYEGYVLASGSRDNSIRFWDTRTHQQLGFPLTSYSGKLSSIAYSSDGRLLAVGGEGGAAFVWEAGLQAWQERACSIANRNLTLDEWQRHFSDAYRSTCPDLPLPPSLVEKFLISEQALIGSGQMARALASFEKQYNIDRSEIEKLEGEARAFPLWNLAMRGGDLAVANDLAGALEVYREVTALGANDPALSRPWNEICWFGSLGGYTSAELMAVCESAVALEPDNGGIRDSRGLARALTGDVAGAIADFESAIAWAEQDYASEKFIAARKAWIAALKAGQNPFDRATLEQLQHE